MALDEFLDECHTKSYERQAAEIKYNNVTQYDTHKFHTTLIKYKNKNINNSKHLHPQSHKH